jgi:hypothetical protein
MDTADYFRSGLAELVEIWHTVRSVSNLLSEIFSVFWYRLFWGYKANLIFFEWHWGLNLISLKKRIFCEFTDVTHAYLILIET